MQGSQVFRSAFEGALRKGQISVTVADLVEAVLAAGVDSLPDATGAVRTAWGRGDFQVYCDAPQVFQADFFSRDLEKSEVWNAVMLLREVYVSPTCKCLTWPLLLAVLRCLIREHIRPSLDVILEVCRGTFGLTCDELDVLIAVCFAPCEAVKIELAPWPVQPREGADSNSVLLASTVLVLCHPDFREGLKVFPPYAPGLEVNVEEEFHSEDSMVHDIESWLQDADATARANGHELTVSMILALMGFQQTPSPCASGGAMLWFWEKMCVNTAQNDGGGTEDGSSDDGSDAQEVSVASHEASAEEEMTPLEAFISCFHEDLKCHRPLYLSQLNNLYRMRSGGHDIKYRSHGYARMAEFLADVPGVELVGSGNQMSVQACDLAKLAELAATVSADLQKRIADLRSRDLDTSFLEISYRQPQGVPKKILARVWDIFQHAADKEIPVNMFVSYYKERYPHDKLRFKSLGYQDLRGLMAHVPFVEKVGGRRHSKYMLKADAVPPEGYRRGATDHRQLAGSRGPHAGMCDDPGTLSQWLARHIAGPTPQAFVPPRRTASHSPPPPALWPAPAPCMQYAQPQQAIPPRTGMSGADPFVAGFPRPAERRPKPMERFTAQAPGPLRHPRGMHEAYQ